MDRQIEHVFYSNKGQMIRVRPMTPQDVKNLVDLFDHMGPDSRFLRFNQVLIDPDPERVWAEAERMAQMDPNRDGAWLAFADLPGQSDAPVAGVRYVRFDDETAEAALAVRDDRQNQGIGTALLIYLVDQARRAGIQRLVASVQHANRSLLHILRKTELNVTFEPEGSSTLIVADLVDPEVIA
jgi:acetyltransferase